VAVDPCSGESDPLRQLFSHGGTLATLASYSGLGSSVG
jgi:hypothetical protein